MSMTTLAHPHTSTSELNVRGTNGYAVVAVTSAAVAAGIVLLPNIPLASIGLFLLAAFLFKGLYMLQPRQAALLLLFGSYHGTDRQSGLRWANPLYRKVKLSLRARNLNSPKIKVNDKRGNPIEIAAAIVWRVDNSAHALFDVEDYLQYVEIQSEAALRHLASRYAYDEGDESANERPEITLRSGVDEVSAALARELQERFHHAGIVVEDAKLTHIAYAPEIAGVMLRRQQAEAVIAARQKIVHGAVSMVDMALRGLSEHNIVELDNERKAAMVSNLLVVLCAESEAQPVINTGTLYT
jgi:regulator of protease activity HflC (stomatin/prohibitin superfamily)